MAMFAVFLFDFIFPSNLITRLNFFSFYVTCLIMVLLGRIVLLTTMKIQNVMKIYNFVLFTFSIYHIWCFTSSYFVCWHPTILVDLSFFRKNGSWLLVLKTYFSIFFPIQTDKKTRRQNDKWVQVSRFFCCIKCKQTISTQPGLVSWERKRKETKNF